MVATRTRLIRAVVSLALLASLAACDGRIDLGTSILWSARHETGDLSEWMIGGEGGSTVEMPDTAITVAGDVAHSGAHAVKLTNSAVGGYKTATLWRESRFPADAYYSEWAYLPRTFQINTSWTIMQFRVASTSDASDSGLHIAIDLRSLPGGELIVTIFDHRDAFLRAPTPDPAIVIPIGRWFHLEARFRNVADDTGRLSIWIDGQLNYDLVRPMTGGDTILWQPCSVTTDLIPTQSEIYVDDLAVSLARVTPSGSL